MSAAHTRPTLARGVIAAFVLSAGGAVTLAALAPWLGHTAALRIVVALLGFGYTVWAMASSGERVGRVTTIACWLAAAGAIWLASLPLTGFVLAHLALVWLVRSLYYYSGVLPALADLGFTALGAAFASWAAVRTGSAWLALWCFFLVQAFHVAIPALLGAGPRDETGPASEDRFARAQRAAEAAVRRMTASPR